jgi:hypothetical protein
MAKADATPLEYAYHTHEPNLKRLNVIKFLSAGSLWRPEVNSLNLQKSFVERKP